MALFAMGLLGYVAWGALTLGPVFAARANWEYARARDTGWIAHVLFCPVLLLIEYAGVSVFFVVSGDTGDGPPGLGLLFVSTTLMVAGTLLFYYLALLTVTIRGAWFQRRA